ncbi:MAG: hypothetical protein A2Y77_06210 [Planctomycetes bacterium RBG_13_62_9]|nr:MAG: hypothetical protein A2Y77_06210 [Planctomycetes bacterium RBG_13_62_9]
MATKRILLVEGNDDEHVIKHICGTRNVQRLDEIKPQGSVEQLLENLPVRLKESDVEVLGIIVDADTDLAARWQSLHDQLAKAGYLNIPAQPLLDGTILVPPVGTLLPRVGIWIMPDNQTKGILEDFLQFLIPEGSRLFKHVQSSVANIPKGEQRFNQFAEPKAIIHTWLAWQKEPGKPLGIAITARYLDPDVKQVDVLVSWLNRLFFQ